MEKALRAKFSQRAQARDALLSTGPRLLQREVKSDSLTIPGLLLADLWMRLWQEL